jgi:hypothetical protein
MSTQKSSLTSIPCLRRIMVPRSRIKHRKVLFRRYVAFTVSSPDLEGGEATFFHPLPHNLVCYRFLICGWSSRTGSAKQRNGSEMVGFVARHVLRAGAHITGAHFQGRWVFSPAGRRCSRRAVRIGELADATRSRSLLAGARTGGPRPVAATSAGSRDNHRGTHG